MRNITATHVNYYHVCRRKLWLAYNNIEMEHTSDLVTEGRLIGENSYAQRSEKYTELELDGIKIDFYDSKNKVVHEVKKSDKAEAAHIAQVKYYLYVLAKNGIEGARGVIEYPKLRHTEAVELTAIDAALVEMWVDDIRRILEKDACPPVLNKPVCKRCSYYDFCYSDEL